jgi:hypothetical protein
MAITLITPPRSPALSKDDNWAVVRTDIPTATARPGFLVAGTADDGDELNLRWGDTIRELRFVDTLDGTPLQIRAASSQTEAEYLAQLMEALLSIPAIEAAFLIELRTDGVRLTLRGAVVGALLATSSGVTVTIFGSDASTEYPNLTAALSLYRVGTVAPIARLQAPYSRAAVTDFNLGDFIDVQVGLPNTNQIGASPVYAVTQPEGFAEYFFRYADKYGRPPQPETLLKSDTYAVVAGGSKGASRYRWGSGGSLQLCHGYFNQLDQFFAKPISYDQPDWCYLYLNTEASCGAAITVYFDDGTTATRTVVAAATLAKGLHAFPAGPRQCGMDQVTGWADKTAMRYTFALTLGPSISYELEPVCPEWEKILAYDNGAGGIETVGFRGKTEYSYGSNKSTFRRARTRVQSGDDGEVTNYNAEGREEYRLRSGYYSQDYILHLRQLLVGRVWLVDQFARKFVPVNVTTSNLDLITDDDDLHALEITIQAATPDRNAHNL